ncbi:hypothetical protein IP90_00979 [Luteimonas cucumeris]|uniref:Uncharacterized protein n=1 Tax=Luteimonas cucumeris TaxID=985012 RepID=A0A562LB28_9GAMM|nr:hypothetical protein IP90_00979 [Luteimonas cucumeris]
MSDTQKLVGMDAAPSNILEFGTPRRPAKHEPPLTDLELVALREMLVKFTIVAGACPVALRVLSDAQTAP